MPDQAITATVPEALPPPQQIRLGIYGYGEVGHGIAYGLAKAGLASITAYQRPPLTQLAIDRAQLSGVRRVDSPAELAAQSDLILAATQGTEALGAAEAISAHLSPAHCYVDLASATPKIKQAIAARLAASGAEFADGILEGSPLQAEHRVAILASGPGAVRFGNTLNPWGMRIAVVGPEIGRAAAIKALRQILTKGHMALLIECAVAARRYGIADEVFASAAQWFDAAPFQGTANRVLRSTTVHARRRAAEAAMAAAMLEEMGIDPLMCSAAENLLGKVADLDLTTALGGAAPATMEEALRLLERYARASIGDATALRPTSPPPDP